MRIGFVTCVQLGLDCLWEIHEQGGKLDILITLDDNVAVKKTGRVYLDDFANETQTPLHKTPHINDPETVTALKKANLDYLLVIGWSQLVNNTVSDTVRYSILGMHPTLLPIGRGRAPIPWTILKGLEKSGVTLFELTKEADKGDILGMERFDVAKDETATTLYDKARKAHIRLIRRLWKSLNNGTLAGRPQNDSQATYWPRRGPEDGEIKSNMSLKDIDSLVRASTQPYPGAFLPTKAGKLIIWSGRIHPLEGLSSPNPALVRGKQFFKPTKYEVCGE